MTTLITLLFIMVVQTTGEVDIGLGITNGYITASVTKPIKRAITHAITDKYVYHYRCMIDEPYKINDILANRSVCYYDENHYTIVKPANMLVKLYIKLLKILMPVLFVIWLFTSTMEEKMDILTHVMCHIIGQIIYDMLHGDDDD